MSEFKSEKQRLQELKDENNRLKDINKEILNMLVLAHLELDPSTTSSDNLSVCVKIKELIKKATT